MQAIEMQRLLNVKVYLADLRWSIWIKYKLDLIRYGPFYHGQIAQSARAVEYRLHLCRRVRPPNECPDMTLNNLIVRFQ